MDAATTTDTSTDTHTATVPATPFADRHGFVAAPFDLPDEHRERIDTLTASALRPATTTALEEMGKIAKDRTLSDVGRRTKRTESRDRILEAMDVVVQKQIKPLQRSLDYELTRVVPEHRLYKTRDGVARISGDRAAAQDLAAQREIRDRMLPLPAEKRLEIARDAARNDDVTTLRAIHGAPKSFPVLSADEWNEVDRLHLERHHPEQYRTVRDLERTIQAIKWNLATARRALGVSPTSDPVTLR